MEGKRRVAFAFVCAADTIRRFWLDAWLEIPPFKNYLLFNMRYLVLYRKYAVKRKQSTYVVAT